MRLRQEIQTLPRPGCLTNGLNLEASTARSEALASLEKAFQICGIENPAREARISLCAASGISPVALIIDPREPLGSAASKVQEVAARRAIGEPLSRIVGKREFWGLSFAITPHVLDPRPGNGNDRRRCALDFAAIVVRTPAYPRPWCWLRRAVVRAVDRIRRRARRRCRYFSRCGRRRAGQSSGVWFVSQGRDSSWRLDEWPRRAI